MRASARSRGARWTLGAAVALALVLGAVACGSGGGNSRPPVAVAPTTVTFTGVGSKPVDLKVSKVGEWQITTITITGTDSTKFIKQDQCANHVFVVGRNQIKECQEVVTWSGVFEAGKSATLNVTGAGINGTVGNTTLHIPLKS